MLLCMTALLYSGGLDSYCVRELFHSPSRDTLVVVDPGTEEAALERQLIDETVDDYEYIDMSFLAQFERDDMVIPFRNTFFAFAAAQFDEKVTLASVRGDGPEPDVTRAWASSTEAALNLFSGPDTQYMVDLPARHLSKAELVRLCDERGVEYETILEETKTCHYGSVEQGCGECMGCLVRFVAFACHDFVQLSTLSEFFQEDPWEVVLDNPQRAVDEFVARGAMFEEFITTHARLPYGHIQLPDPSEYVMDNM